MKFWKMNPSDLGRQERRPLRLRGIIAGVAGRSGGVANLAAVLLRTVFFYLCGVFWIGATCHLIPGPRRPGGWVSRVRAGGEPVASLVLEFDPLEEGLEPCG